MSNFNFYLAIGLILNVFYHRLHRLTTDLSRGNFLLPRDFKQNVTLKLTTLNGKLSCKTEAIENLFFFKQLIINTLFF
jgi:hypothetical protein